MIDQWQWHQPKTQAELLSRLADARDLDVPERERENLCACAVTEIERLNVQHLTVACAVSEREDKTELSHQKVITQLRADLARVQGERDAWRDAIIDAAVVGWVYTAEHDTNPRKAVRDLLAWEQHVALDPAVSKDARDLVERAERAESALAVLTRERDEARADIARYAIIYAVSQMTTVEHFLALDDTHKRLWFAAAIDDSERRKQAEAERDQQEAIAYRLGATLAERTALLARCNGMLLSLRTQQKDFKQIQVDDLLADIQRALDGSQG